MKRWLIAGALLATALPAFAGWQSRDSNYNQNIVAAGGCSPGAEATAFLARTSGLNAAHTNAYCTMINGLVTDGVFAKLDALYIFATDTSTNALLSLVSATYNATVTGTPTFTADTGYTTSLGNLIDTGFNPTTAPTPKFVQNSATAFGWSNTSGQINGSIIGQTTTGVLYLYTRHTTDVIFYGLNDGAFSSVANTDGSGFYAGNRTASNATQAYKNGSSVATASPASTTPGNANIVFGRGNGAAWAGQVMAGGFGQSLSGTEQGNLYARVHTYLQTIAGIP